MLLPDESMTVTMVCGACTFRMPLQDGKPLVRHVDFTVKRVDQVIGEDQSWANTPSTAARCEKCENTTAYYRQIQTRSADEPMTEFYRCTKCHHKWKN